MIYTRLVNAAAAQQHALQIAPMLQDIQEAWPGPGGHKVRLPGGKYVKPGFATWCKLHDGYGASIADNGYSAACVLLDWQTPAEIVPEPAELQAVAHDPGSDRNQQTHTGGEKEETPCLERQPGVDQQWHEKYNRHLWFHFTPAQLAAWYNERHQVEDILPPEENGMGLASWRGEHTASVGLREEGWVDFGVQPLSVVDNPDISPTRLTFPLEAPYCSYAEENCPFSSFQAQRILRELTGVLAPVLPHLLRRVTQGAKSSGGKWRRS